MIIIMYMYCDSSSLANLPERRIQSLTIKTQLFVILKKLSILLVGLCIGPSAFLCYCLGSYAMGKHLKQALAFCVCPPVPN